MIRLLFIFIIVFIAFWFLRQIRKQPLAKRKKLYFNLCLWGLISILLLGFLTNKLHWLGAFFALVLGLIKLSWRFLPILRLISAKTGFANPTFTSQTLRCQLDTQSLRLSGEVLEGEFKGKTLDQLSADEIITLQQSIKVSDKKAYYLLSVYQQLNASNYDQKQTNFDDIPAPNITEAEQILGLVKGYTQKDIIQAHRKLMQKLHPDRGGNNYLASRINLAKQQLLDHLKAH